MLQLDLSPEEAEVFLQEAEELLLALDEGLVRLEDESADRATLVQEIFRAAHTLKGSAGMIGHSQMAELLHAMESLLDRLRHSQLTVTPAIVDALLAGADMARRFVAEVATGQASGLDTAPVLERLRALAAGVQAPLEQAAGWELAPPEDIEVPEGQSLYEIRCTISRESVAPGARALQVLLALAQAGHVLSSRPQVDDLDEDWEGDRVHAFVLAPSAAALQKLLESISEVEPVILPAGGEPPSLAQPQEPSRGETPAPTERAPSAQPAAKAEGGSPEGDGGGTKGNGAGKSDGQVKWVRTSVERLDKLMNLVSELVTDRNRLLQVRANLVNQFGEQEGVMDLTEALTHISSVTDQLQDEVMRARMVPIEHVFNKFPRVVRDLARQLGKQVSLVIEGQETELDRTVIEEVNDPLLHLVRNAIDHGLEPPEERRLLGKPEKGLLRLAARSEESHIIIEVQDDGRGMDPHALRQAAVERGFLDAQAAAQLGDQEALELIFAPGFSTARKVSGVSGRGVGMDVVRTNIERLGGSVSIRTELGKGTTFELKLPLTLAIFPALTVEVLGSVYAIPLSAVVEALQVRTADIKTIRGREAIVTRGRVLPVVSLARFFYGQQPEDNGSCYVVEVRWGGTNLGLAVQRLLGRQEVVIKPLGRMVGEVPGISGGTIMGDGRVALIMDVASLVRALRRERQSPSA